MRKRDEKLMDLIETVSYAYDRQMRREERNRRELEDVPLKTSNLQKLNEPIYGDARNDPILMDLIDDIRVIAATSLQTGHTEDYIREGRIYDYVRSVAEKLRRPRLEKLVGIDYKKLIKLRFDSHQGRLGKVFSALAGAMSRGAGTARAMIKEQVGDADEGGDFE